MNLFENARSTRPSGVGAKPIIVRRIQVHSGHDPENKFEPDSGNGHARETENKTAQKSKRQMPRLLLERFGISTGAVKLNSQEAPNRWQQRIAKYIKLRRPVSLRYEVRISSVFHEFINRDLSFVAHVKLNSCPARVRAIVEVWSCESSDHVEGCDGTCIRAICSLSGAGCWSITNVAAFSISSRFQTVFCHRQFST